MPIEFLHMMEMNMLVIKGICAAVFVLGFPAISLAGECLSRETVGQIEKVVFTESPFEEIRVYDESGEENLDIGYTFSKVDNFTMVKHFRPNFSFVYLVTDLESGSIIESSFYTYGILEGDRVEESFRVFFDDGSIKVLCGEDSVGEPTINPIINILPDLR